MLVIGLWFLVLTCFVHAGETPAPFKLSIVPSRSTDSARTIALADHQPDVFYVVLTNTSSTAQAVWLPWYSWGYWTISFELTMPDGTRHLIRKTKEADFTRNFPATFLVPVGEPQVYAIRLDKEWVNRPRFSDASSTPISLKAIYEVLETPESTTHKVWTGRIESRVYEFTLNHW
jgi:hypothetical protein